MQEQNDNKHRHTKSSERRRG